MNLFDLYAKVTLDTGDYEGAVDRSSALGDKLADAFDNIVRVSGSVERNVDKIASSYKSAEKEMKGAGDAAEDAATRTAGDGSSGSVDTWTFTCSDGATFSFTNRNGKDGTGQGDMTMAVYDPTGKKQDIFAYCDAAVEKAIGEALGGGY